MRVRQDDRLNRAGTHGRERLLVSAGRRGDRRIDDHVAFAGHNEERVALRDADGGAAGNADTGRLKDAPAQIDHASRLGPRGAHEGEDETWHGEKGAHHEVTSITSLCRRSSPRRWCCPRLCSAQPEDTGRAVASYRRGCSSRATRRCDSAPSPIRASARARPSS